jgi:hypothetical protein
MHGSVIAEDYLTQVYETYLREPCPKGHTLGQIYDLLHYEIRDLTAPSREELKTLDPLYEEIQQIQQNKLTDPNQVIYDRLSKLMRELITTIRADRRYFNQRIDDLHNRNQRGSIFRSQLRENLTELIRYRNAASHKTRIPLGNYEAVRSLYCLTSFLIWWRRTRDSTNWSNDRVLILKDALAYAET